MPGSELLLTELFLLNEILKRRRPELAGAVERIGTSGLTAAERERVRRAVVDELCELPDDAGRRALELEELLIRLERI